jgi:exodeoxyribonuclease VII large subunit
MLLSTLSYQSVLQRGFALVRDAGGRPVRAASATSASERLELEFRDGRVDAEVLAVHATDAGKSAAPPQPAQPSPPGVRRSRGRGGSGQGSLF